jgi:dTMP kinase
MVQFPFITIEGICGTGKTTIMRELNVVLEKKGYQVMPIEEFASGFIDGYIQKVIARNNFFSFGASHPTTFSETLLMLSEIAYETEVLIWPNVGELIIISDRYIDSIIAYQTPRILSSYKNMTQDQVITWIESCARPFLALPDLTFLLTAPESDLHTRITSSRKIVLSDNDLNFMRSVNSVYEILMKKSHGRIHIVDSTKNPQIISEILSNRIINSIERGRKFE